MSELPLAVIHALRNMTDDEAKDVFNRFAVSEEDREQLKPLVGKNLRAEVPGIVVPEPYKMTVPEPYKVVVDPVRNHWMATAYMLGASYRMLGKMHGITAQTVFQGVRKHLPENRNSIRLGYMLQPEVIAQYYHRYMEQKIKLYNMTPLEAARWLVDNAKIESDSDPRYEDS